MICQKTNRTPDTPGFSEGNRKGSGLPVLVRRLESEEIIGGLHGHEYNAMFRGS
jgi:hypothetical protein